jgi:TP901 family phage tail tape measure protein
MAEEFRVALGVELKANALDNVRNQINSIQVSPINLQINTRNVQNQINSIRRQIQSLGNIRINLGGNVSGGSGNAGGTRNINNQVNSMTTAYKKLLNISKQIGSIKIKLTGIDTTKDVQQIEVLERQLQTLTAEYHKCVNKIKNSSQGNLSTTQWQNIQQTIDNTKIKLEQLSAQVRDSRNNLAQSIKVNIDNGSLNNDLSKLGESLSKIRQQSTGVTEGMRQLNAAMNELQAARQSNDVNRIITSYKKYEAALKNVKNQIDINARAEKQAADISKLASAKSTFASKMDIWLSKNSAAAKQFGWEIDALKAKLEGCDKVELDKLKAEFADIQRRAEMAGKATMTFSDRFSMQMSRLSSYFSAATLIAYGARAVRSMYDNVVEVDTAMTELYRVTDLTSKQYDKLYENMISSAKEYGASLTDIITSTADWVRLGFDADTANQLSEITTMYQHISDLDNATAVENLVTAYKGFQDQLLTLYNGDEAAAIQYIADIFNELGNNYAVAAEDVGAALTKSASALELAGNTIQQSAAMVVGITEVTQDPEKAGSSLKILSLRLRGMKGQLEELGEEVDENVESISKMQTQILNFTGGKVNIFNDDGSFKSTYEIMQGIAEIYDDLSDTDKADLLETIAGKNRANDVAALISNWEQVEAAMKSAMEAEGSAAAENEKYMESLKGHLDALKASWQSLSETIMSSEFVKVLIDGLTGLVNVLDTLFNKFGTLPVLLGGIAGVMSFKNNTGIFKVMDTELTGVTNKLGIFGKSLRNIMRDAKSGQGIMTALFSNMKYKDGITPKDVKCITNFMNQIKSGVPLTQAWKNTMTGATVAGKQMAVQVKTGAISLKSLTKSANASKVAVGALKVAVAALNVAFTMGLSLAIQAIITGLDNWKNSAVNASKAAKEFAQESMDTAKSLSEERDEIDELIAKYKELKDNENIDSDTRNEIKSIQERIVNLVGDEASGLDLVNGKLDEELIKLKEIQLLKAQNNSSDYVAAYSSARKSFDSANVRDTSDAGWAQWTNGLPGNNYELVVKGYDKAADKILDIIEGVEVYWDSNLFSTLTEFKFDADNAQEYYDIITKCIEALENPANNYAYQDSDVYNKLVALRNEYEEFINTVSEASQELLDSTIVLEGMQLDVDGAVVDSYDSFVEYKDKLIEMVSNNPDLSAALANGDITAQAIENSVIDYLSSLPSLAPYYTEWINGSLQDATGNIVIPEEDKISFADLISNTDSDSDFIDRIDAHIAKINKLQEALKSLKKGDFDNAKFIELIKEFPELADNADDLDSAIADLLVTMNTDITTDFANQFGRLKTDEDIAALQNFQNAVLELGQVVGNTAISIDISAEAEGMDNLFKAMKESVSSTGLTAESIKNLKARYQDLENYDAARLFERTSNGIHLNTKALRELESAYENQKKAQVNADLQELVDQYNDLTREIDATSDAAKKAELYAKRADIQDQINDTADLAAMYEGLTSAFYKWEQAQSIGEEGDMYDSLAGSLENIKKLYDEGLIGTNKFRTAVQLMSNEDLSTASIDELLAAYDSGYSKMTRYFTDSSDGCLNFLNDVQKLNSEWVKMNSDGSWDINFGVGDDQSVADALGINVESVQAILRKLSDYGFDINLDSIYTSLDLLQSEAEKAVEGVNKALKDMGKDPVTFNFDTTNITEIESQITQAKSVLDLFRNSDGTVNLQMEGAEEAQEILVALISQKQLLNSPSIMSVDTSQAETDIGSVIALLQDYQQNYNDIEINTAVGADTSAAQTNIQSVLTQLEGIPAEQKMALGLDTEEFNAAIATLTETPVDVDAGVTLNEEALAVVTSTIEAITPTMIVEAGVDPTLVEEYEAAEHTTEGTVIYNVNDKAVDRYSAPTKYGTVRYTAKINSWTVPTRYGTVIYTAKMSGTTRAEGTAHAHGTVGRAFKNGNWGSKESGVALGGELGQELVVRDGRFFTIGDESAEFFNYKKGDIIFNAEQTKQIFEKGKISSGSKRGNALANGTAYAEGNAFSGGSGSIIISGNVVTTPTGNGSSSSNNSSDSSEKEFKESFDWIEIAIDRVERAISRLDLKANSIYKSWSTRNKALKTEISEIEKEISIQMGGYERYMAQANSVGLSEEWAAAVRNGSINISTITDEGLAEKIKEYQEWYEKALNCRDAIDELNESLAECYQLAFDNVVAQYDGILAVIGHERSLLEEYIAQSEAKGYIVSTQYYDSLIENERKNIIALEEEKASLLTSLQEAMASGTIEKDSEAWYNMIRDIDEVTLAIEQGTTRIIEYENAIQEIEWEVFDLMQNSISQMIKESEFLINLMSGKDLHTDNGQLTNEGKATMGLHAQNYNLYMSQADNYAEEIKKINQELANDPYNQQLVQRRQELLGLQQESIIAAENEKQAIIDMVNQGIELELSALEKLITSYTDALDSAKDLYDYQKKIANHVNEIGSLEKQLSAYQGDTSEEAKSKIQQLKVSLEKEKNNLEDTQYNRYISDTKKLFDELYLEYESILNQRLDNIDGLISDMITAVNNNAGDIATTIFDAADKVGYTMSEEIQNIWQSSYENAQEQYRQRIEQTTAIVNQLVANGVISQEVADSILAALANGDAQSAKETLDLINQLIANGVISQEDANKIITALSLGNQKQVAETLKLLDQLVANGTMSQEDANKIITALVAGDTASLQNASNIISQLISNGELSREDANKIITALSLGNQKQVEETLKLLDQLVANGVLSQEDANKIIAALIVGDKESIKNANNIISQLVSNGTLSQEDANKIINAVNSSQRTSDDVVTQYGKDFSSKATTINNTLISMKSTLSDMLKELTEIANSQSQDASQSSAINSPEANTPPKPPTTPTTPTPSTPSTPSTPPPSSSNNTPTRSEKDYYGVALAIWNGNYGWGTGSTRSSRLKAKGFDATKMQNIVNKLGKDGYVHSGAWAGKYHGIRSLSPYHYNKFAQGVHNLDKDQLAWTQEDGREMIIRPSDGAILTPLAKTDSVLKASASNNIWDMANNPTDFIRDNLQLGVIDNPVSQYTPTTYTQNLDSVVFNLPNVRNYEELLSAMQNDKNFERLILAMTIDRVAGKSSLSKGKAIR